MAKYPYMVNKNGIWYPAGAEVPDDTEFKIDGKVVGKFKDDAIEITDKEIIEQNQYTKTDINRMSTAELKEVALLNGIGNAEDMTGGELKKILIKKFGL